LVLRQKMVEISMNREILKKIFVFFLIRIRLGLCSDFHLW
jgi:hypothetical protein